MRSNATANSLKTKQIQCTPPPVLPCRLQRRVLRLTMAIGVLRLFGREAILEGYCLECGQWAFVMDNRLLCCDDPYIITEFFIERASILPQKRSKQLLKCTKTKKQRTYQCYYCGKEFFTELKLDGKIQCCKETSSGNTYPNLPRVWKKIRNKKKAKNVLHRNMSMVSVEQEEPQTSKCRNCGVEYPPERSWQKFCSERCRVKFWEERHPRTILS